jgi:outer membrane lipoprotein carrier protein
LRNGLFPHRQQLFCGVELVALDRQPIRIRSASRSRVTSRPASWVSSSASNFTLAKYLLLILGVLLCHTPLCAQVDVQALAAKVDRRYDQMRTLEAQFTETYTGVGLSRTESGALLLKKPGRMRWDYDEPRPKLFLADGQTAWFYVPGEHQARRTPVKQLDDLRSPLRYLLGKTKLEKELQGLSFAPDRKPVVAGDVMLRGVPKGMQDRVAQTLLEIAPDGLIVRIVVEELDGSLTEFRFLQQRENVEIPDTQFRFVPAPGVEVVAGTEFME